MAAGDIRDYKVDFMKDIISVPAIVAGIDSRNEAVDNESPDTLGQPHKNFSWRFIL